MEDAVDIAHGREQLRQTHHVPRDDLQTRIAAEVFERGQRSLRQVVEDVDLGRPIVEKLLRACGADQACASHDQKPAAVDRHGRRGRSLCNRNRHAPLLVEDETASALPASASALLARATNHGSAGRPPQAQGAPSGLGPRACRVALPQRRAMNGATRASWRNSAMDATALKALQAPLKDKYREAPETAVITLKAEGHLGEGVTCSVQTGKALVEAGLHPATGGTGMHACSGDMLLEALVACAGVTLNAVATALGLTVRDARIRAEGDLDFRGTLGVAKEAPVGFRDIRLTFEIDGDLSEEQKATLMKLTERYCVVYQTLRQPPPVAVTSTVAA